MSDTIIAVVPATSDLESVQESLSPTGVNVKFIQSFEEALRLLGEGSTPVFFCEEENRKSWREPALRLLQSGAASRVVLLSTLAQELSVAESCAAYSGTAITV